MNARLEVPAPVRALARRLESAGFETWTVGGAIRDALRGRPAEREDWDLSTRATPAQMRRVFRRTVPLGPAYGTLGVFGEDGAVYEVTTFRHDVLTYGRRAVVAFADTVEEDLARRDFTMNAIAWHPLRGELCDPHGGRRDLAEGILRAVGDPAERFREDYLRVLRGLRFAGVMSLEIEAATWRGMTEAVPGLDALSRERVREELLKVLAAPAPARALDLYRDSGALDRVLRPGGAARGSAARAPGLSFAAVGALSRRRPLVRLAGLLLLLAGQREGGSGVRAADSGVCDRELERATLLLRRLRFSRAEVRRVVAAMRCGLGPSAELLRAAAAQRRRWVAETGWEGARDGFRLWGAALRAGSAPAGRADVLRVVQAARRDRQDGVPLSTAELALAGRDLVESGWKPGPAVGAALQKMLAAVWENPSLNSRCALLGMAAEMEGRGG